MAYQVQYQDTCEYLHDTDMESVANQQKWGVISGAAVTYDSCNLTVDIAAGLILHNGNVVSVCAQTNALTLVADACNERWSYITLDACGCAALVSGTAASCACTEPAKPELGCRVPLAMVKIEAAQTVANCISVKLDKRAPIGYPVTLVKACDQSITLDNTLNDDACLTFYMCACSRYLLEGGLMVCAHTCADIQIGVTQPACGTTFGVVHEGGASTVALNINGTTHATTTGTIEFLGIAATASTGGTAGNWTLRWAQGTSNANCTTLKAGSWLRLQKIG